MNLAAKRSPSKLVPLEGAVRALVRPGMHLNFASTPSRSNAAIRELARAFRGTSPGFVLSTTGFHSMAHLLGLLRLGRRYIACFFGDNCPVPRPIALSDALAREGAGFEHWSVLSYVTALRAGALGDGYGVTRSLYGSTLGGELARIGRFFEVADPCAPSQRVGLVTAMRPDLTFLHAAAADPDGNVAMSAPLSEGFWGALAAREGAVVTVEHLVEPEVLARLPEAQRLPSHRVRAVCLEPFGAHPQPSFIAPTFGLAGHRDDFEHYSLWRSMTSDPALFARFCAEVLDASDGAAAYRAFVGEERLASLRRPGPKPAAPSPAPEAPGAAERMIIVAARQIARRVRERGYPVVLAGVGHAFFAARLAKLWLSGQGVPVEVIVETGLLDVECGPTAHGFLLSHDNVSQARRLSSVEDALGVLTCGADNRCLGVIGAAQVDSLGNVNSTRLAGGRLLVGSGGANDIASCATEVLVLAGCNTARLVPRVDYITSPGRGVRCVATDLCALVRDDAGATGWQVAEVLEGPDDPRPLSAALAAIGANCPWRPRTFGVLAFAPPVSPDELSLLRTLDPEGLHTRRD
ncbi:MAG: CoA-transferase [Myxococcaceae bacterium]